MLKMLTLITIIFAGSIFAADRLAYLKTDLEETNVRAKYAARFVELSNEASEAKDAANYVLRREELNTSLTQLFEQMTKEIGDNTLLMLHGIGPKDNATTALGYYQNAEKLINVKLEWLTHDIASLSAG
jgi:hypothetical protein